MWREVIFGLDERKRKRKTANSDYQDPGSLTLNSNLLCLIITKIMNFIFSRVIFIKMYSRPNYEVGVAAYTMHRYGKAGDEMSSG